MRAVEVGDDTHAERVPLFSEALQLLTAPPPLNANGQQRAEIVGGGGERLVHCFAEIKSEGGIIYSSTFDPQLTAGAALVVNAAAVPASQLTWISFSLGALLEMKRLTPSHACLLIQMVGSSEEAWKVAEVAVKHGLDGIDLNADPRVITPELVAWLHERGKTVAVWVFRAPASNDNPAVWEHMTRCGVDYFTSNLPSAVHAWRPPLQASPAAS